VFSDKGNFLYFLRKYIAADWVGGISADDIEKIDKSYVTKEYRNVTSDIIYRLKLNGADAYFYLLLEMQSKLDNTMPFRLLQYMTAFLTDIFDNAKKIRNKADFKLPAIVPLVLYNGAEEWTVTREYRLYTENGEFFGDNIINFKYLLFDLNRTDEEKFRQTAKTLLDYVFLLDYGRKEADFNEIVKQASAMAKDLNADDLAELGRWIRYSLYDGKLPPKEEEELITGFAKGDGNMTHAVER
jgi:hypothetical protein